MGLSVCVTKIDAQGRELLEHGTMLFPIACYHDDLQKEWVPWHWHEELELILVTEGKAVVAADSEKVLRDGERIKQMLQYVIQFRVEKAAVLLTDTEMKITEIGVQRGFLEMSYFARTFRRVKGCTLSEYRRKKRKE